VPPTFASVPYASTSPAQTLDLYLPGDRLPDDGEPPCPLVVRIHGGAFLSGDKALEAPDVPAITEAGYAVAAPNYRLSGEARFPAAVRDVKAAVRFLRAGADRFGLDPDRFAAWGASAGANLAAMIGVTGTMTTFLDDPSLGNADVSSAVQAVVGWYGPYDFTTMDAQFAEFTPAACTSPQRHDVVDSPESLYLGAPVPAVPELAASACPTHYLGRAEGIPPFLLAAGDSDCYVPYQQSEAFHRALTAVGAASSCTLLPGALHGDPVFPATQTGPALAFLRSVLGR